MILRRLSQGAVRSMALYSDCERYRYLLRRRWAAGPEILVLMLNPSTATVHRNDPTIERCERRARRGGFGTMTIANLFAWRATRPEALARAPDPEGAGNAGILDRAAGRADLILCGWGVHGALGGAGPRLADRLTRRGHALHVLGLTRDGHPRHPLYVPYSAGPVPWHPAGDGDATRPAVPAAELD